MGKVMEKETHGFAPGEVPSKTEKEEWGMNPFF